MTELDWLNSVALHCKDAKPCRGGAFCYADVDHRNYCEYERCPKVKNA